MSLAVVCLSLRRSEERRARFDAEARRAGLTFEYWDAPDALALTPAETLSLADQDKALVRFGRRLGLAEIACSEGHRQIYRRLVQRGDDAAVIFEDDVDLGADVVMVVQALSAMTEGWGDRREVYLLGGCAGYEDYPLLVRRRRPREVTPHHSLVRVVKSDQALHGTFSYFITRAAAAAILAHEPVISTNPDPWDLWLAEGVLDDIWMLEPPVAMHPAEPSGSLLQAERSAMEAEVNHRRLERGLVRRAWAVAMSPPRMVRSLAYRLGWRRAKRFAYAWLSWV